MSSEPPENPTTEESDAPEDSQSPEADRLKEVKPEDIEKLDLTQAAEVLSQVIAEARQTKLVFMMREWWDGLTPEKQAAAIADDGVLMKFLKRAAPVYGLYYSMYKEPKAGMIRGMLYYGLLDGDEAMIQRLQGDESTMEKGAILLLSVASVAQPELKALNVPVQVLVAAAKKNREFANIVRNKVHYHEKEIEAAEVKKAA